VPNQIHTSRRMIQFYHCDPAGIVYYPRFFDICSDVKEEFMMQIGFPHHDTINRLRIGWPIVRLETDFKAVSRYGDQLDIDIQLWRLGASSIGLQYRFRGDDGERLLVKSVLVYMSLDSHKPVTMSDEMRAAFAPYLIAGA
jgi:4-hydroxybenzoyl-CoA thioesterase